MRKPSDGEATSPAIERHRAVFAHPRRLSAVRCLARTDDELHLADLARDVARREAETDRGPADEDEDEDEDADAIDRIYVDLYHVHLPKLAEVGVVSFDPESRVVSAAVDARSVQDWVATDDPRAVLDAVAETAE
ncbi:hypothetical protein SAMN05216559_4147 [Halomicrobium zhouii]|uniref:DUF7344 domain-containing protein n=1 Tax=Halomicrobium zhouii TaxID=767519 RepID=A0A1I6MB81_9EURY|nr:hypothetical protein [Halomicrobium zhouii]SFS12867.1 hypothetical protein SAMN05216559_4147 [Halomicrobium zhouii]